MKNSFTICVTGIGLLGAMMAEPLATQTPERAVSRTDSGYVLRTRTVYGSATQNFPSARRMLSVFSRSGRHPLLAQVIVDRGVFPSIVVDSVVMGLERIALTNSDASVRNSAVSTLAFAGRDLPEATELLIRIFRASNDRDVRANVLSLLPLTPEREQAVTFLRSVAMQETGQAGEEDESASAITSLARLGTRGEAVLRDLHARDQVRSPGARAQLEWLARTGYREPQTRRQR